MIHHFVSYESPNLRCDSVELLFGKFFSVLEFHYSIVCLTDLYLMKIFRL